MLRVKITKGREALHHSKTFLDRFPEDGRMDTGVVVDIQRALFFMGVASLELPITLPLFLRLHGAGVCHSLSDNSNNKTLLCAFP